MDEQARQTSSKLTVPVAVDAALGAAAVATSAGRVGGAATAPAAASCVTYRHGRAAL
jgi:hypothetical protein